MLTTNSHGLDIFKGYSKKEAAVNLGPVSGKAWTLGCVVLGPEREGF